MNRRADYWLWRRAIFEFGRIDIVVINAGGLPVELYEKVEKVRILEGVWAVAEADWDRLVEVNFKSVFLTLNAFMPYLIEQGEGDVIAIGSRTGRQLQSRGGGYS